MVTEVDAVAVALHLAGSIHEGCADGSHFPTEQNYVEAKSLVAALAKIRERQAKL